MKRKMKQHPAKIQWEKKAKKIYRFYVDFLFKTGKPPTEEEIGLKFKVSRQRVSQWLEKMAKQGYLVKLKKYHLPYYPNWLGIGNRKKVEQS
ncbi:MAG: hypothetical protein DDT18_01158 [Actinobacteria bacterium]|nr:hypothetical protein [Actinomycetota bacterium]